MTNSLCISLPVLLVFVVIFGTAIGTLFVRARRRKAQHRNTLINGLPLAEQQRANEPERSFGAAKSMVEGRKKSMKEKDKEAAAKQRMNLAFGVVDDDEPNQPATRYTPSPIYNQEGSRMKSESNPSVDPMRGDRTFDSRQLPQAGIPLNARERWPVREPLDRTKSTPRDPFSSPSPQRPSPSKQKSVQSAANNVSKTTYKSDPALLKPQRSLERADRSLLSSTSTGSMNSRKRDPSKPIFSSTRA
ncbi:hypothetical protein QFC19_001011 [Naganishia cerealis]|uniref:Uncharacterized protein n=1 Tax=Naganishia cerealis TaxID=610337 RepID=A0ACC2WIX1_9TREE|nr:hypothetical protein QFC19_001011 [Naganishia cerealis]